MWFSDPFSTNHPLHHPASSQPHDFGTALRPVAAAPLTGWWSPRPRSQATTNMAWEHHITSEKIAKKMLVFTSKNMDFELRDMSVKGWDLTIKILAKFVGTSSWKKLDYIGCLGFKQQKNRRNQDPSSKTYIYIYMKNTEILQQLGCREKYGSNNQNAEWKFNKQDPKSWSQKKSQGSNIFMRGP